MAVESCNKSSLLEALAYQERMAAVAESMGVHTDNLLRAVGIHVYRYR
jgi:hypothetical protein